MLGLFLSFLCQGMPHLHLSAKAYHTCTLLNVAPQVWLSMSSASITGHEWRLPTGECEPPLRIVLQPSSGIA